MSTSSSNYSFGREPSTTQQHGALEHSDETYRIVLSRKVAFRNKDEDLATLAALLELSRSRLLEQLGSGPGAISGHLERSKAVAVFRLMKAQGLPVLLLSSAQYSHLDLIRVFKLEKKQVAWATTQSRALPMPTLLMPMRNEELFAETQFTDLPQPFRRVMPAKVVYVLLIAGGFTILAWATFVAVSSS